MARFHGLIGFGKQVETAPGVNEDVITELPYFGDVVRNSRNFDGGDKVNSDISLGNSISILADEYARGHFFAMKYIHWAGVLWIIDDVEVQHPRLVLRLGGVYHGPTPSSA